MLDAAKEFFNYQLIGVRSMLEEMGGGLPATGGVWLVVVITDRPPKEPRFLLKVQLRAACHEVTTPRLRLFCGRSLSKT